MSVLYPQDRIEDVLTRTKLPPSYRIIPARHAGTPLGTVPADSRFCASQDGFTVLYAAPDFATAFIETVVRDRFTQKTEREIALREVTERTWVLIASRARTKLSIVDLRDDGCVRLGAPTDAVRARNHSAGRALGRALYTEHEHVDAVLFSSRLTGTDVYAVFDRAIDRLEVSDSGDLPAHPALPDVLERHRISLMINT